MVVSCDIIDGVLTDIWRVKLIITFARRSSSSHQVASGFSLLIASH